MNEPSDKDIARFETALKADIYWVVSRGPGFNPGCGAEMNNGVWYEPGPGCGVCAIGAACVRRQPPEPFRHWCVGVSVDVIATAKLFGLPVEWVEKVYYAVGRYHHHIGDPPKASLLAKRLREYGLMLMREQEELRDDAAQKDQRLAEKLGLA